MNKLSLVVSQIFSNYKKSLFRSLLSIVFIVSNVYAINPILPLDMFTPDVEAHKWADGKMYLYGSHDIPSTNTWCSTNYHVFSSSELVTWTDHGESFRSASPNDQVPWTDAILYAPDCAFANGKYFLYFCLADFSSEGVATSSSPTGPFTNGIKIAGTTSIDPGVFIDDDGQGYLYWGQYHAYGAKLKANMLEIDPATKKDSLVYESKHHFHEGSSMRKRNGIYYYVYADISRGKPSALAYSTGNSPLGPFTYKGIIIDNNGCDPSTWNNHGSIQEFGGKWYVFYHRSSRNSQYARRVCVEPITFNADGTIPEVKMTSQGLEGPIDASKKIEAEYACQLSGKAFIKDCSEGTDAIDNIQTGDYAVYRDLDFGDSAIEFQARAMATSNNATIEIRLESINGTLIGTCPVSNTTTWTTHKCKVSGAKGVHPVFIKFVNGVSRINWFTFTKPAVSTQASLPKNSFLTKCTLQNGKLLFFVTQSFARQHLDVMLTDVQGRCIKKLISEHSYGGNYSVSLKDLPIKGMFILSFHWGNVFQTFKVIF